MKATLWLLALFTAAVAIVYVAKNTLGHATLVLDSYDVNLKLQLEELVISIIVLSFVFYVFIRFVLGVFEFGERHRIKKTDEMLLSSLKAYFEGDYTKAKKNAAIALKLSDSSLVTALSGAIAARSAHELDKVSDRDKYIDSAIAKAPEDKSLGIIAKADFLINAGQYNEALDVLHSLYADGGLQSSSVLLLEIKAQQQAKNWDAVLELTDTLAKRSSANQNLVKQLRRDAQIEKIKSTFTDVRSLDQYWQQHVSPMEKTDSKLAVAAARAYMALNNCNSAHQIIEHNLPITWDAELIELYAECLGSHVSRQIELAEVWLRAHPNNATLLLTLGKLCAYCEIWGKAENYLEASLSVEPSHKAHLALAQLYEKLGKHEAAITHYNKGLEFTLKKLN